MWKSVRLLLLGYFISHIPITLLVDAQIAFGDHYPEKLRALFAWYVSSFGDVVLRESGLWLKSFVYAECFVQLPFFFYAAKALLSHAETDKAFSVCALAYGVHVATTVLPILTTLIYSDEISDDGQRLALVGIYAPYFLCPLLVALDAAGNLTEKNNKKKAS